MVLVLLAGGAGAGEPKTYTIKFKEGGKGDAVVIKTSETFTSHSKLVDGAGKTHQDEKEKFHNSDEFEETILEKPAKEPYATKLKRQYKTALTEENGKKRTLPFQGKTILIEKKDGKYKFQIEGGKELTGEDAQELDDEFNKERSDMRANKLYAPNKAVALNEMWKIDPEPFLKGLQKEGGVEVDKGKIVATGKLTKVYEKDGRQFGVLIFHIEAPIKSLLAGVAPPAAKVSDVAGKMTMLRTVDGCIDGSSEAWSIKGTMQTEIKGTLTQDAMAINLTHEESGEFEESWVPVTRK
jgi:hypothetical protein